MATLAFAVSMEWNATVTIANYLAVPMHDDLIVIRIVCP